VEGVDYIRMPFRQFTTVVGKDGETYEEETTHLTPEEWESKYGNQIATDPTQQLSDP
jgi:hypothetical protein